jgi:predicted DNA-binding transcriptional regulator YafY
MSGLVDKMHVKGVMTMGTTERRKEIMRILCRRRYETVSNLASEFGVSERTIQRDIHTLSESEPIYTQCGRYGGGVYVVEGYTLDRMYMSEKELSVLHKLLVSAEVQDVCDLSNEEIDILSAIISLYTKPCNRREG